MYTVLNMVKLKIKRVCRYQNLKLHHSGHVFFFFYIYYLYGQVLCEDPNLRLYCMHHVCYVIYWINDFKMLKNSSGCIFAY